MVVGRLARPNHTPRSPEIMRFKLMSPWTIRVAPSTLWVQYVCMFRISADIFFVRISGSQTLSAFPWLDLKYLKHIGSFSLISSGNPQEVLKIPSLTHCLPLYCLWIQHLGRVVKKAYYAPPFPSRKTPVRRVVAGCFPRPPHWKKRKTLKPSLDQRLVKQHRYQRNFLMRHRQKMVIQKQAYGAMGSLQQQHIATEWPMLERRFQAGLGRFTLTEEGWKNLRVGFMWRDVLLQCFMMFHDLAFSHQEGGFTPREDAKSWKRSSEVELSVQDFERFGARVFTVKS